MKTSLLSISFLLFIGCSQGILQKEEQLAFEAAKAENTMEAFNLFAFKHPNSKLFPQARLKSDSLHEIWMNSGDYPLWHCKPSSCLMILINQDGQVYIDSVYDLEELEDKFLNLLVSADTYLDEYTTQNGQKSSLEISKGVAFVQYDSKGFEFALRGVHQLYEALYRYREIISQEWLDKSYDSLDPYQKDILDARMANKVFCINGQTAYNAPPPPPNIDSIIQIVE